MRLCSEIRTDAYLTVCSVPDLPEKPKAFAMPPDDLEGLMITRPRPHSLQNSMVSLRQREATSVLFWIRWERGRLHSASFPVNYSISALRTKIPGPRFFTYQTTWNTLLAMPLIFLHGVNTRSTDDDYQRGVSARKQLFEQLVVPRVTPRLADRKLIVLF